MLFESWDCTTNSKIANVCAEEINGVLSRTNPIFDCFPNLEFAKLGIDGR